MRRLRCEIKANINIINIDHVFKLMNFRSDPNLPCDSILMENMLPRMNMRICNDEILHDFAIVKHGIELYIKQGIRDKYICAAVYSYFY